MLRWCSYCQNFMGESAPYDDFSWTDGICAACKTNFKKNTGTPNTESFNQKLIFFRDLRERALKGDALDPTEILEQSTRLGINAGDVLIGILQPILCEIGNLFEQCKISTIEEHRFSVLTEKILNHFEDDHSKALLNKKEQVILASADQNYHTIGVRILALLLGDEGIRVRAVVPSVPAKDLVRLCLELKPRVLGISLFSEKQVEYVNEVVRLLGSDRPNLVTVGGYVIKEGAVELDSSVYLPNPRDLKEIVDRIKSACET